MKFDAVGCGVEANRPLGLTVTAGNQTWSVQATAASAGTPRWGNLWAFPAALGLAILLGFLIFNTWERREQVGRSWKTSLPKLGQQWSLTDSWANSVTVIVAAFTGVFGASNVLTPILGEDTDNVISLVTVSAAIAVGLVGAAPLLLLASRSNGNVTVFGLLAGAALTLAATGGELAVVVFAAASLDLGLVSVAVWIVGLLGAALLVWYAWRSILYNLESGLVSTGYKLKAKPPARTELRNVHDTLLEQIKQDVSPDQMHSELFDAPPELRRSSAGSSMRHAARRSSNDAGIE